MVVLFIRKPLEFNAFPSVLLIATMLRLALNLASTRLILGEGHTGTAAAGEVIHAFGSFMMQGNPVIGVIVFAILVLVNFTDHQGLAGSRKSPRGSAWTRCPASKWRLTPTCQPD